MLFKPLFEFDFLLMDNIKVLVQDFCLRYILAEELDLMLKSILDENPLINLGLCEGLLFAMC